MLLYDFAALLGFAVLFFVCGWGVISPLKHEIAYPAAASIMAGLLALSTLTLTIHVATAIRFPVAFVLAAVGLISLSLLAIATGRKLVFDRSFVVTWIAVLALAALSCVVFLGQEAKLGSPALVFFTGSDQFGYAHLADWITASPRSMDLDPDPKDAWSSWVDYMVKADPRFGSISTIAIASLLTNRSGLFSYNLACAMVMVAGSVGLAGVFARTTAGFVLVLLGSFTSSWFSLSMAGFFGKICGYPASFFCVGMFFALARHSEHSEVKVPDFLAVLALMVSAALMYSAFATGTILLFVGAMLILASWAMQSRPLMDQIPLVTTIAASLIAVVLASGAVARPLYPPSGWTDMGDWIDLWIKASQVTSADADLSLIPRNLQGLFALAVGVLCLAICALVVRQGNYEGIALMAGVAGIAALMVIADRRWQFYQSISIYIPAVLYAVAGLPAVGRSASKPKEAQLAFVFAALVIALGMTRFVATVKNTSLSTGVPLTQSETDQIARMVGPAGGAVIDTPLVVGIYALVLELHRKGIPFQLSAQAWSRFMAYRPWQPPNYGQPFETTIRVRTGPCPDAASCTEHYVLQRTGN